MSTSEGRRLLTQWYSSEGPFPSWSRIIPGIVEALHRSSFSAADRQAQEGVTQVLREELEQVSQTPTELDSLAIREGIIEDVRQNLRNVLSRDPTLRELGDAVSARFNGHWPDVSMGARVVGRFQTPEEHQAELRTLARAAGLPADNITVERADPDLVDFLAGVPPEQRHLVPTLTEARELVQGGHFEHAEPNPPGSLGDSVREEVRRMRLADSQDTHPTIEAYLGALHQVLDDLGFPARCELSRDSETLFITFPTRLNVEMHVGPNVPVEAWSDETTISIERG